MSSQKNKSKINVLGIVKEHFATLVNANTNRPGPEDWLLFLFIPLLIAFTLGVTKTILEKDLANTIITILSIFVGLLINVIVLLFDLVQRDEEKHQIKNVVLRETLTNISYTILVSLTSIVITLLTFLNNCYVKLGASILVFFLSSHIAITLLMVIKRNVCAFFKRNKRKEVTLNGNKGSYYPFCLLNRS